MKYFISQLYKNKSLFVIFLLSLLLPYSMYGHFFLENYYNENTIAVKSNIVVNNKIHLQASHYSLSSGTYTNYASNKSAYASSTNSSSATPEKVLNGTNDAGGWDSRHGEDGAPENQWIVIDLGTSRTFNLVNLYWETAYANRYTIQVSDDASAWTTVYSNGNSSGGNEVIHFNAETAQYIRIYCHERNNDQYGYHIYEIQVYRMWFDMVHASSTNTSTAQPYKVLDGDTGSGWDSRHGEDGAPEDQWITVDFGYAKEFNYIKIFWESAYAKSYKIQVSDDSVNWTTLVLELQGDGGTDIISLPTQQKRYFRLYCYERVNDSFGYHVYEIEFYKSLYDNQGYVTHNEITPPYIPSWEQFYYNADIPTGCSGTVKFLDGSGSTVLSKNLYQGLNNISISGITSSTLAVRFDLTPSVNQLYTPSVYGFSLSWSTTTNYLGINSLRLTGQSSKVNKESTSQVTIVDLGWSLPSIGAVSQFDVYRAESLITEDSVVSGLGVGNGITKIITIAGNRLSYEDASIPDIEKDYCYVICSIDTNGYRNISNNIKVISYPLTDLEGWVWTLASWFWQEAEIWDDKDTGDLDYKSNASDGICLGSSWSGWAEYQFSLDSPMSEAYIYLRYASIGVHKMDIYIDDNKVIEGLELADTREWNTFVFSYASLGLISNGKHTIKLDPDDNLNFDGFYLYDGYFEPDNTLSENKLIPPSPWRQRKIIITYLDTLTDDQKYDAQNNPMIKNPKMISACIYSVEGIDNIYFRRNVPVNMYFSEEDVPVGITTDNLAIFYWDNRHWIKMDSGMETHNNDHIITSYVNHFSTFAVFESNPFDTAKKAWWTYNPFSPNKDKICDVTELQFYLKKSSSVTVNIYNLQGRIIKTLIDGKQRLCKEVISCKWDGTDNYNQQVEAGIYIYQIESDGLDNSAKVINGTIVLVR